MRHANSSHHPTRPSVARLADLPSNTLIKIVEHLMPTEPAHGIGVVLNIIRDVLPFACVSRSCCEAVLAVFDAYHSVAFDHYLYQHVHLSHEGQLRTTSSRTTEHDGLHITLPPFLLYRAAACAYSVLSANNPAYQPTLSWTSRMPLTHSPCCCRYTAWCILGLLKTARKTLWIGNHLHVCLHRRWRVNRAPPARVHPCEYNTCLVNAEVFTLRRAAVESLHLLGMSQYPPHVVRDILRKLLESCRNTLTNLVIRDACAPVMSALCNASRQLKRLRSLEIDTDLSETLMNATFAQLFCAVQAANVPIQSLFISHQNRLSNVAFAKLPSSLTRLHLSSRVLTLPKQLHSHSLRVLTIQCVRFDLTELLRLARCSKLPQLQEVHIQYLTGQMVRVNQNLTPEETAFVKRVSHLHTDHHTFALLLPLPSSEFMHSETIMVCSRVFTELNELSLSLCFAHMCHLASYLRTLPRLTKLRLSTVIGLDKRFCFDGWQIEQSGYLIDALRCSRAPLRTLQLNGVYNTKETYRQMMHTFRQSLLRLEMILHSPWHPADKAGVISVRAGCADVVEVLWAVVRQQTKLQFVGFGFASGVRWKMPFDAGAVMTAFEDVQERMLDRGVLQFSSDCIY